MYVSYECTGNSAVEERHHLGGGDGKYKRGKELSCGGTGGGKIIKLGEFHFRRRVE